MYRLTAIVIGAMLGVAALPGLLLCTVLPALAADGGQVATTATPILRYAAPDGSIAFTNMPKTIPKAVDPAAVKPVAPSGARWTYAEPARAPYRWTGTQPSFEQWNAEATWRYAAERSRRGVEDAQVFRALVEGPAGPLAVRNAERRAERLEEGCRRAGCLPGYLR